MDAINMEQVKDFLQQFLVAEAEALSNATVPDLERTNHSIKKMHVFLQREIIEGFPPLLRSELKSSEFYKESMIYKVRHLYKLSHYKHGVYGDIWVAYVSGKNPTELPKEEGLFAGSIVSEIENELKIIGSMTIKMNRMTMETTGWKGSVYNPEELNIKKLGRFIAAERYTEPEDDGFSMADYLADK